MKIKNLFVFLLTGLILGSIPGCKTISYENAVSTNEDKFYGEKEDNAIMLVKLQNYSQWAEDISGLTEKKVYSKDLYDFGQDVQNEHNKFQFRLKMMARLKGIRLPNSLKKDHQDFYRSLHEITDPKTFDISYMNQMEMVLDTLQMVSEQYRKNGSDDKIRDLVTKHSGVFKAENDRIQEMQQYLEKSKKQNETELSLLME